MNISTIGNLGMCVSAASKPVSLASLGIAASAAAAPRADWRPAAGTAAFGKAAALHAVRVRNASRASVTESDLRRPLR